MVASEETDDIPFLENCRGGLNAQSEEENKTIVVLEEGILRHGSVK